MKELVVISGKGGTGKTSIVAAFASLAKDKVLCDADVDAADLHLIMDPKNRVSHDFQGGHKAKINPGHCTRCGLCRDLCRWDAVTEDFRVPAMVCVNKFDLNPDQTRGIEEYVRGRGLAFLGRIPFDPIFTQAMVQAKTIIEYDGDSGAASAVRQIWVKVAENLGL